VVILPESSTEQASVVAERIRTEFSQTGFTPRVVTEPIYATLSAGVTTLRAEEGVDFLKRADQAMYQAKSAGRNRVIRV
jgi:diguanylate cyclase (GGDEF)-like protein